MRNFYIPMRAVVAAVGLVALAALPVRAGGPVVCLAGAGNVNLTNVDLSTCDVPVDRPLHVVLQIKSTATVSASGYLAEGALTCSTTSPQSETTDCVVTVADGSIDQVQVGNSENYRLLASWWSYSLDYTQALSLSTISFERSYTYGERAIGWLLVFIAALMLLLVVMMAVLIRRN